MQITSAVLSVNVLVVHPSVPAHSVKELIALARKRPNELAYGTSGTGGAGHLAGALFRQLTKTELLHVPYKGGGPAMIDLVAGQTQLGFASQPSAAGFIRDGRLRALAVTTARRSKLFPQLPTIAEAGVPGYESHAWYGFVVPAKTPQPVEVWTMTPDEFGAYIRSEVEKWTRVIPRRCHL